MSPPFIPIKKRVRRKRKVVGSSPTPPPFTLVSVDYSAEELRLDLSFDRAIDVSGINVLAFTVNDSVMTEMYQGDGEATLLSATTVRVGLRQYSDSTEPDVHLTAGADNGIKAVSGGEEWAGVTELELPFPP